MKKSHYLPFEIRHAGTVLGQPPILLGNSSFGTVKHQESPQNIDHCLKTKAEC
jgi:hypothetical protein